MAPDSPRDGAPFPPSVDADGQQWAIQRRIGEIFSKLGEKLAELTGRVDVQVKPETSFDDIGGLAEAKGLVRNVITALTDPELYRKWGITPPKGMLIYGPPGTGKTLLARALATEAGAVFYHLKLGTLTSKFGPNTGELLQELLGLAKEQGKGVVLLDQAEALALEHLLPPAQAREAGARIAAALCEKIDTLDDFSRLVIVAATARTDSVDPSLVAPGRLDHLVEVPLPDATAQQQILALARARAEHNAGRPLVAELDYRVLLPPMGGMSGGEIRDILRRALEEKVHTAGQGQEPGPVTT
ncbi:MAG TPA: ATP-binding protein, partial [Methylomirabilota bacterium]|nr:ATP-binding protein [Methylomirabilota bacterium]